MQKREETTDSRGGIFVLVAIGLISLNLRTAIMGFVPVLDVVGENLGFGAPTAGVLATLPPAVFGVMALVGPALVRFAGGELLLAVSGAVTTVGIVARSFAIDQWTLAASFVVAIAGIGIANVVLVPVIKQYFSHRLGAVNGFYQGLTQLGPIVAPLLAAVMIEAGTGWRWATGIWAGAAALAMLAWSVQAFIVRRANRRDQAATVPDALGHHAREPDGYAKLEPRIPFSLLVRSPLAWGIMALFGMNALTTYTLLTLVPGIYLERGASLALATGLISVIALLSAVVSVLVPWLTVRIRPFGMLVVLIGLIGAGLVGLLVAPMVAPVLWVVLISTGLGCSPAALTLMNLRSRTGSGSAGLSGFGQGFGFLLASFGPIGISFSRVATGEWTLPIVLLLMTLPIMLVAAWYASRPHMIEDDLTPAPVEDSTASRKANETAAGGSDRDAATAEVGVR